MLTVDKLKEICDLVGVDSSTTSITGIFDELGENKKIRECTSRFILDKTGDKTEEYINKINDFLVDDKNVVIWSMNENVAGFESIVYGDSTVENCPFKDYFYNLHRVVKEYSEDSVSSTDKLENDLLDIVFQNIDDYYRPHFVNFLKSEGVYDEFLENVAVAIDNESFSLSDEPKFIITDSFIWSEFIWSEFIGDNIDWSLIDNKWDEFVENLDSHIT